MWVKEAISKHKDREKFGQLSGNHMKQPQFKDILKLQQLNTVAESQQHLKTYHNILWSLSDGNNSVN